MSERDEFDWSEDSEDVLFQTCPGVAVYQNAAGHITIRNERDGVLHDQDPLVVIPIMLVPRLIDRLKLLLAESLNEPR